MELIGKVLAVVFAIADPLLWNAKAIRAFKQILGAIGASSAMRFIGIVATVIVAIAKPFLVNAA